MNKYNKITLDGCTYNGSQLLGLCQENMNNNSTPEWLKHIHQFIYEWLNDSDEIVAHTSGSTGVPKKIYLKKKHMVASALKTNTYFKLDPDKSGLLCLSANYIAGKMMIVRAFVGGFNLLIQEPSGNPLGNIVDSIDFIAMVPIQVSNSIEDIEKGDKVKDIIIGGGAISKSLTESLRTVNINCYETYGMTETVSHVAIRKVGDPVFKAMPDVFFLIDDRNCLLINADDITDSIIITNDVVELKSDKEFIWLGRYDNIINTGGIKVVPEEIERKLSTEIKHPFFVSSMPDDKLGHMVVLVFEKNSQTTEISEFESVFSCLNKYERPKRIYKVHHFPYTENNKIKRTELMQMINS